MRRLIIVPAVLLVGVGVWWYIDRNPETWRVFRAGLDGAARKLGLRPAEAPDTLVVSGFIEADEATVATDLGGRIVTLYADEGDPVTEGQVLVELDDSLLLAQMEAAEADLAAAEAMSALVEAKVRQQTLDHAKAVLDQAKAAQEAARVAWEDARAMRDNPQELNVMLAEAKSRLGVLRHQEKQSLAMANSAQTRRELADEALSIVEDFEPFNVAYGPYEARVKLEPDIKIKARNAQQEATYQAWEAWTGYAQSQAARAGAERYLAELERQVGDPVRLQSTENAAESQYQVATSAVAVAQAQIEGLQIGATPEQIAAARAVVELDRAALESLRVQLNKLALQAPISGLVLERPVHVGELATPGAPLMTVADLDTLTLTVYIPEDDLGKIRLGQPVRVAVDAHPGRTFLGTLSHIASEAEFTPKNVQTREERVNMVFAAEIKLPNVDHTLKPGMPADAVIQLHEE